MQAGFQQHSLAASGMFLDMPYLEITSNQCLSADYLKNLQPYFFQPVSTIRV